MTNAAQNKGFFSLRQGIIIRVWRVSRLWELASGVETIERSMDDFDLNTLLWPDHHRGMTVATFMHHCRRCRNVDVSFPIILSSDGIIMDGMHRLVALGIERAEFVPTIQFEEDPEPDYTLNTLVMGSIRQNHRSGMKAPGRIPRLKQT